MNNSSKMDILNSDLHLKEEAKSKKRSKAQDSDDEDATFHFIAFLPAMGQVWKLDGLERQPQAIGSFLPVCFSFPIQLISLMFLFLRGISCRGGLV